ncbi:hypothetical protein CHUAL_003707 [Chamberlinius hualienensis]
MNEDKDLEEETWTPSREQQIIQELENEQDIEEHRRSQEKDFVAQKCWQLFQNSATAIAQLYKDRQLDSSLWSSFQTAAGAVTCLYKEALEFNKQTYELGLACGRHSRNKEILSWIKKHRRPIRREDLIAFLCNKSLPTRSRSSPRQRLTLERNNPRINVNITEPTLVHNPEVDFQTFEDALNLASLSGAMSNVSMGYLTSSSNSPPIGNHSRRRTTAASSSAYHDFSSLICEDYTTHCDTRKRNASSTDVIMDSPTHKRSRLS